MHAAIAALAIALQTGRGSLPPSLGGVAAVKPDPLTATVIAAERKYFDNWFAAWTAGERDRARALHQWSIRQPNGGSELPGRFNPRQSDLICYFNWDALKPDSYGFMTLTVVPEEAWGANPMKRAIASKKNDRHWVCPNWYPPNTEFAPTPVLPDERLNIDGALDPDRRELQHSLRARLIQELESYVRRNPRNNFVVGQLVRLLVDNQSLDDAERVVHSCRADEWWCHALAGYVYHRRGDITQADEEFTLSTRARTLADRCKWTDLAPVLDGDARSAFSKTDCADRDSLTDVVWWLADPLWSVPGNDRRNEQFAREMTIQLHTATGQDERYNWYAEAGGDALAEMIRRYGWPSYTYAGYQTWPLRWPPKPPPTWGVNLLYEPKPKGPPLHTTDMDARALGGINTTFEYSIGRLHLMPTWSMISDPFAIKREDWATRGRGGEWDLTLNWWPQEHYAPLHPLADIDDDQHAFLRRQDQTLFAFATNLSQVELARGVEDSVTAQLIVSTGPDDITMIDEQRATAISRVALMGPVPAGKSLVSAEVPWDSAGHFGARARFAISAPPPLSAMPRGTFAISDPVLLVVPPDVSVLTNEPEAAVHMMRGSTTLAAGTTSLGVYWETYGFAARDSVEITITIQRTTSLNLLRGLGVIAGIAGNPNAPVSVSWKEPQRGHDARTVDGAVPIQMRSVILSIGTLTPGEYTLEMSVRKPGNDAVKSARAFVVR